MILLLTYWIENVTVRIIPLFHPNFCSDFTPISVICINTSINSLWWHTSKCKHKKCCVYAISLQKFVWNKDQKNVFLHFCILVEVLYTREYIMAFPQCIPLNGIFLYRIKNTHWINFVLYSNGMSKFKPYWYKWKMCWNRITILYHMSQPVYYNNIEFLACEEIKSTMCWEVCCLLGTNCESGLHHCKLWTTLNNNLSKKHCCTVTSGSEAVPCIHQHILLLCQLGNCLGDDMCFEWSCMH